MIKLSYLGKIYHVPLNHHFFYCPLYLQLKKVPIKQIEPMEQTDTIVNIDYIINDMFEINVIEQIIEIYLQDSKIFTITSCTKLILDNFLEFLNLFGYIPLVTIELYEYMHSFCCAYLSYIKQKEHVNDVAELLNKIPNNYINDFIEIVPNYCLYGCKYLMCIKYLFQDLHKPFEPKIVYLNRIKN